MDLDTLAKIISGIEAVAEHVEYILNLAKPSVDIELVGETPDDAGSRFGGHPLVPKGFQWPSHEVGEYRFLGQINFAEIINAPESLPKSGLLSIFYAFDEDGEVFWGDDGYIRGFYWADFDGHSIFDSPTDDVPAARKISLTGGVDIPRHEDLREDWPFDSDELYQLTDAIAAKDEYLLGYPSFTSLAYDPTPDPEWISLLTVHSLDDFDWCWHDGDKLMVFIESENLEKRDFSNLKSDAG